MIRQKVQREGLFDFGHLLLEQIVTNKEAIAHWKSLLDNYQFLSTYKDDDYSWLTCILALKAVYSGNFGVGAILVDDTGTIIEWGHNEVFNPYFRSDRHAEMVVIDHFEDSNPKNTLKNYSLYTSLESCPMCLARIITSGISKVVHVAEDINGGMTHKLNDLPLIWIELSKRQIFNKANCSKDLTVAAEKIFLINAQLLNEILKDR